MEMPEQQRFVKFFESTRLEDLEAKVNAFLSEAENEGLVLIGTQYTTCKEFEGGVWMIKHFYSLVLARPDMLTQVHG